MSPRREPDPDIRRCRTVVFDFHAHLVLATRYRRGAFDDAMLDRREQVIRDVCADFGAELREFT